MNITQLISQQSPQIKQQVQQVKQQVKQQAQQVEQQVKQQVQQAKQQVQQVKQQAQQAKQQVKQQAKQQVQQVKQQAKQVKQQVQQVKQQAKQQVKQVKEIGKNFSKLFSFKGGANNVIEFIIETLDSIINKILIIVRYSFQNNINDENNNFMTINNICINGKKIIDETIEKKEKYTIQTKIFIPQKCGISDYSKYMTESKEIFTKLDKKI